MTQKTPEQRIDALEKFAVATTTALEKHLLALSQLAQAFELLVRKLEGKETRGMMN